MGAGAGSKPDQRHQAMQIQHQKLTAVAEKNRGEGRTAPAEKGARGGKEPPLALNRLAAGDRRILPCDQCGKAMGTVPTASGGTTFKCGFCMNTAAARPGSQITMTDALEEDSHSRKSSKQSLPGHTDALSRRPSKQGFAPLLHPRIEGVVPEDYSGFVDSEYVKEAEPSTRTGSKQSVRSSTPMMVRQTAHGEQGNSRAGSKQSVLDASSSSGPHVHQQKPSSLQRRKTSGGLLSSDEAMGGLVMGDRVVFQEQDQTAVEFGIGTVVGPTATHGNVMVKFDNKKENTNGFNLKADGLRKLNMQQETTFKASARSNIKRRSTIG